MAERTPAKATQTIMEDLARDEIVEEMVANDIVKEAEDGTLTLRTSFGNGITHEFLVEIKLYEVTE